VNEAIFAKKYGKYGKYIPIKHYHELVTEVVEAITWSDSEKQGGFTDSAKSDRMI
jgi:hypothetical protein